MTAQAPDTDEPEQKAKISLYEFYAIGIEKLIVKAPWELERTVSAYHESFLTEQRCLGLSILLLLGEDHVPKGAMETMPGFEDKVRESVNLAIFKRALKHYFEEAKLNPVRADLALKLMQSYIADSRKAAEERKSPLEAMLRTMSLRVPPKDEAQKQLYAERVEKIYDYVESLVESSLLQRYEIIS